jgi:UDP-glucose 4-epimerase
VNVNPFAGSRALVTGGCGFIGSHLVEALVARGASVTVVDNLQAGRWSNLKSVRCEVACIQADVRDRTGIERIVAETAPQYVFHLAANASVPASVQEPAYDFESNAAGTFNVLNAVRAAGSGARTVVASSGAVYGEPANFPISEDDALAPISPYGASKLTTEVQARMFSSVYATPVMIARLFNAYGPRMARFVILDFLRKLTSDPDRLEVLGNGRQIRDFTYVSDTVDGLLLLASEGAAGESYNVSSGASCSVTELAHKLIAALGLTARTQISFTGASWVGDAQRWEVSIAKLAGLGYRSCVSLDEGLRRTHDWYIEAGDVSRG